MTSTTRTQKSSSITKEPHSNQATLWKKLNSTSKIEQMTTVSKFTNEGRKPNISPKPESSINSFLNKMHHRISDSVNGSESQVMEKMSIDWGEEIGGDSSRKKCNKTQSYEQNPLYSQRSLKNSEQLASLAQLGTIEELLMLISQHNSSLYKQLSQLIDNHTNLELECETLKYRQKKSESKIQLLTNQLLISEKKNIKLTEDFANLKREVQIQINLEEERIKYKYEKLMQEVKDEANHKIQEFLKKNKDKEMEQQSTQCSNSMRLTYVSQDQGKYNENNMSMSRQEDHPAIASESAPKRGKIVRSNRRQMTGNSGAKINQQKEKNRYICGNFNKNNLNQSYDKIVHQILKQDRKEIRSLKLPSH